MFKPNQFIRAW